MCSVIRYCGAAFRYWGIPDLGVTLPPTGGVVGFSVLHARSWEQAVWFAKKDILRTRVSKHSTLLSTGEFTWVGLRTTKRDKGFACVLSFPCMGVVGNVRSRTVTWTATQIFGPSWLPRGYSGRQSTTCPRAGTSPRNGISSRDIGDADNCQPVIEMTLYCEQFSTVLHRLAVQCGIATTSRLSNRWTPPYYITPHHHHAFRLLNVIQVRDNYGGREGRTSYRELKALCPQAAYRLTLGNLRNLSELVERCKCSMKHKPTW